jgi:hypothetical protein
MTTLRTSGKTKTTNTIRKNLSDPKATVTVCAGITHEMIAHRAFEIWKRKGKPEGLCQQNWQEAEAELKEASEKA